MKYKTYIILCSMMLLVPIGVYAESRPNYVYDNADMISPTAEMEIEEYLRNLDANTSNEIIIYTIESFTGHGITKDGMEIQERDMLANYIFNDYPLNGITGIGKAGKDNGVLILMSLEKDGAGGSMRIEVGRGLEGDITDGTAGEILDAYLVPARAEYLSSGIKNFDNAFYNTVIALSNATDGTYVNPNTSSESDGLVLLIIFVIIIAIFIIAIASGGGSGGGYGGYSGGYSSGGGYSGGGGSSGGGGAGR